MIHSFVTSKKFIAAAITILSIVGYGYFVFAVAPSGGYVPAETLNPSCAPGDTDCFVKSLAATNGITATGTTVKLGGTLSEDTTINLAGNDLSIINGTMGFRKISAPGLEYLGIIDSDLSTNTANIAISNTAGSKSANMNYTDHTTGNNMGFSVNSSVIGIASYNIAGASTNHSTSIYIENSNGIVKINGYTNDAATVNTQWQNTDPLDLTGATHDTLATIYNNGNWQWNGYQSSRDDSGTTTPVNFIYTDISGKILSAPTSLLRNNWYAENATVPGTLPVATGASSIAIGGSAAALDDEMVVFGTGAGNAATNAERSVFVGYNAGNGATNANNALFLGNGAGSGDVVNNASGSNYSILIGPSTSTGGFSNSIALGSGATNNATNQFIIGSVAKPINQMVLVGDYTGGGCTFSVSGMTCS
ncbi:hypothetical protein EBR96_09265, partial [bacterium]|nr:hypothetical protein [bacterium]